MTEIWPTKVGKKHEIPQKFFKKPTLSGNISAVYP
jgi:hypothetical protein